MPAFGVEYIKVKVDTGARSSSLHVSDLESFERDGATWARFTIHPEQRKRNPTIHVESEILEYRSVRSSSGKATLRPVVVTTLELMGVSWEVELTLSSRDEMGFRMLLGREAFRGRALVDANRSFLGGKRKIKRRKDR